MNQTTQNEQFIVPRRCCTNPGTVRDVLVQRTSRLEYGLFIKRIFNRIIVKALPGIQKYNMQS